MPGGLPSFATRSWRRRSCLTSVTRSFVAFVVAPAASTSARIASKAAWAVGSCAAHAAASARSAAGQAARAAAGSPSSRRAVMNSATTASSKRTVGHASRMRAVTAGHAASFWSGITLGLSHVSEWAGSPMECLDANAVQDLMSDALEAGAKRAVVTHLDSCADCRELVGVLAKDAIRDSQNGAPTTGLEATALGPVTGLEATKGALDPLGATVDGTDRFRKSVGIGVGRQLGRYTLVERLGAGAMGVV